MKKQDHTEHENVENRATSKRRGGPSSRREFLKLGALVGVSAVAAGSGRAQAQGNGPQPDPQLDGEEAQLSTSDLVEASIADLQAAMSSGRLTARQLVRKYLKRINEIDVKGAAINSVIELNPDALDIARALDEERRRNGPRGPLHGIPILLKDNIDTGDKMQTTAGSLALVGQPALQDATVAKSLRDAGAVILGKANLSEWANARASFSSSGWSGRGGQTLNPSVLDRNPCGSSSGSAAAVSASLCAAAPAPPAR